MRIFISIFVVLSLLLNSGCAIYEKETTNRGGYLDYVLDEHWMKADSKRMRALRAFAMQVSLTRVASVSAKNESDRQLLAIRIGSLTKRFFPIYACAFNDNPLRVAGAENDPCFYYDSAMVDYSTGLFDLAMIALPIDDARKLLTTVTGAAINPVNIIDLLNTLLQIGKDAIKYGRVVGALYRDTVELEVQVWLATPEIDRRPSFQVTVDAVKPLSDVYQRGNDDMQAWLAAIAALRDQGLEPLPQRKFFIELDGLMNYICSLITKEPDPLGSCQVALPMLNASAPIGLGNVIPGRGPQVVVVKPRVPKPTPTPTQTPTPTSGGTRLGEFEEKMKPEAMKEVLTILCRPGDTDLGPAGSPTRKAMAGFLSANSKVSSEKVTKDVVFDLRDLQMTGKKPAGCS
jgi:hypothetical protein